MRRLRNTAAVGLAALALTAFAAGAQAQVTSAQQSAIKSNCRSDFMSKCSGVTPGGKDALACLQKNIATLAPACKTAVSATLPPPAPAAAAAPPPPAAAAAPPPPPPAAPATSTAAKPTVPVNSAPPPRAKVEAARRPAAAAVAAPAPAAPPAQTQPQSAAVTTAPPPAAPAAGPKAPIANAAVMLRACKLDLVRHCRGVQPGGGRELACLAAHEDNLTIRCKMARKVTSPLR